MADRIKLLPDSVANQIAAGEVVNRPASVVKELMENAVDAGASTIMVNFRDGGRELIQIKDDGVGMSPQDARLAFERHATSKISSIDDIYSLMTFGFRGEALASIAAVAQVETVSRQENSELGTRLLIDGGSFAGQTAVAAPKGTQMWIRNLFYNVPARKKFLDKGSTEAAHILTEFQRVALAHPEIAFQLYRDDAPVYNLPEGSLHQRVVGILGKGSAAKLLEVSVETSIARVSGFIARPAAARQRNKEQFLFVNGRFFKSPFFHKAVIQGYEKLIPATVQPSYFIFLTTDPDEIDVNVHPQKTEVKFGNQGAVWQIINAAVRETLAKSGAVPMMDFDSEERIDIPVLGRHAGLGGHTGSGGYAGSGGHDYPSMVREPAVVRSGDYDPFRKYADGGVPSGDGFAAGVSDSGFGSGFGSDTGGGAVKGFGGGFGSDEVVYDASQFEYISSAGDGIQRRLSDAAPMDAEFETGTEFDTGFDVPKGFSNVALLGEGYASALYGGRLVAVDLRRAHEAVLFERFFRMISGGRSATQQLLFPERMALSADDFMLLGDHAGDFEAFGFDIRRAGDHAVEIFGTPPDVLLEGLDDVIYEMLDALRDGVFTGEEARRQRLAAVMARAGSFASSGREAARRMSVVEAEALLVSLASSGASWHTPQGKPVMTEITLEEIKNRMK